MELIDYMMYEILAKSCAGARMVTFHGETSGESISLIDMARRKENDYEGSKKALQNLRKSRSFYN
ncbi:MAG: hypothetical protein HY225_03725 [Candidatus Vogelbacteria bacterium]|nr:hypothetical protein [Candidatus Vogelbacteria bacterium]